MLALVRQEPVAALARLDEHSHSDIPSAHMADGEYLKSIAESFIERFSPSLLEIYVTGFTPALCAVLSVCKARDIKVICWHYDRATDGFWRQDI